MPSLFREDMEEYGKYTPVQALQAHLKWNFYPPLPLFVIEDTVNAFKQYWAGECALEDLAERCHLRDTSAVERYFNEYLPVKFKPTDTSDLEYEFIKLDEQGNEYEV